MVEVVVVIGAGQIGQAIARRISSGKHVVLADLRQENAQTAAEVFLNAGFDATTAVIAPGGAGVVISSQSGHRLPALTPAQDTALATTPAEELLALPMLAAEHVTDAAAVRWAKRGAGVNTISPGIVITPLARDELTGTRSEGYRRMIDLSPVGRAGTSDEIANLAALLMSSEGAFITGSDILADGGSPPPTSTATSHPGDPTPEPHQRCTKRSRPWRAPRWCQRSNRSDLISPPEQVTGRR